LNRTGIDLDPKCGMFTIYENVTVIWQPNEIDFALRIWIAQNRKLRVEVVGGLNHQRLRIIQI